MFKWLTRRKSLMNPKIRVGQEDAGLEANESVGVQNESDREYRLRRIEQITANLLDDQRTKAMEQLDLWVIDVWENDSGVKYLPRPLWDDEAALTRDTFVFRSEAIAYVETVGGSFL